MRNRSSPRTPSKETRDQRERHDVIIDTSHSLHSLSGGTTALLPRRARTLANPSGWEYQAPFLSVLNLSKAPSLADSGADSGTGGGQHFSRRRTDQPPTTGPTRVAAKSGSDPGGAIQHLTGWKTRREAKPPRIPGRFSGLGAYTAAHQVGRTTLKRNQVITYT